MLGKKIDYCLLHSPFGDHLWGFFRVQIPWRGILFSQEALLRLRQDCFRPGDGVSRSQDVAGGPNLMSVYATLKRSTPRGESTALSQESSALKTVFS